MLQLLHQRAQITQVQIVFVHVPVYQSFLLSVDAPIRSVSEAMQSIAAQCIHYPCAAVFKISNRNNLGNDEFILASSIITGMGQVGVVTS